jgi:transglutaminase-like putative cysteine protease
MTWRIAVTHTTRHRYAREVVDSYNEARIIPLTLDRQICLEARVEVEPSVRLFKYWDYWGTIVNAFDLHVPHPDLEVRGRSVVETSPSSLGPGDIGWDAIADPDVLDRYSEFLVPTPYVSGDDAVLVDAADALRSMATPAMAARGAAEWVGSRLRYQPGATDVGTSATEALQRGEGVCQDFAHLTLALLRSLGIPARYVSGYLHPNADAGVGESVTGQSHAWVDWWCGGWQAWDPTHGVPVGERHVVVGRGRDYADVPPLKGLYHGVPAVAHEVSVELTRTG